MSRAINANARVVIVIIQMRLLDAVVSTDYSDAVVSVVLLTAVACVGGFVIFNMRPGEQKPPQFLYKFKV